ncbi:MAG: hypothetical protein F6K09_10715 [Merismopedia sp. SIO2A8]|nr:hypothetical protein [Merismopedia sp. SIO2A8]
MKHYCDEWIQEWCDNHGWTDPVMNPLNHYWAFPPGGVMPVPIPAETLQMIKAEKGLSAQEQRWSLAAIAVSVVAMGLGAVMRSPMPLVAAFAFTALIVAGLEVDEF